MAKGKDGIVVGLDIGTTKICAIVGSVEDGRISIIGTGTTPSRGLRKGVVIDIDSTVECIKKAVDDAGRDQLVKFFEKHHLLPPQQSMKEKGIVDTVIFEVVTPLEEFNVSITERHEDESTGGRD